MAAAALAVLLTAALVVSLWSAPGPGHPGFVIGVSLLSLSAAFLSGNGLSRVIPANLFAIRAGVVKLFRRVGAARFGQALRLLGCNRVLHGARHPVRSPADISVLAPKLRSSAAGHCIGLALHIGVASASLAVGEVSTAMWLMAVAIPVHAYPVMLQLLQLDRMEPVLSKKPSV